jgi:hypothetical protein
LRYRAIDARRGVASRVKKEDVSPPSDPQVAIGAGVTGFPTW